MIMRRIVLGLGLALAARSAQAQPVNPNAGVPALVKQSGTPSQVQGSVGQLDLDTSALTLYQFSAGVWQPLGALATTSATAVTPTSGSSTTTVTNDATGSAITNDATGNQVSNS